MSPLKPDTPTRAPLSAAPVAGPAGGYPGLVVAAADAPLVWKAAADFQATGTNDQIVIQAALDAQLSAGGGTVQLSPGTFVVDAAVPGTPSAGSVRVGDNVTLAGAGIDVTVIRIAAGSANDINGVVRTPSGASSSNVTFRDFTVDGNKGQVGAAARQIGFFCGTDPGSSTADYDIRCYRLRIANCNAYGFDPHALTIRLVLEDCIAEGNGALGNYDGFALDQQVGARVERCFATGNGRHGFNIVTRSEDVRLWECVARGNGASGFQIHEGSSDVLLVNCTGNDNTKSGLTAFGAEEEVPPAGPGDVVDSWRAIGCEFNGNGSSGVNAYALHRGALLSCRIADNVTDGITIQNLDGFSYGSVVVNGCTITGNREFGIAILGVPRCRITGNRLLNNCAETERDEIRLETLAGVATENCLVAHNLILADPAAKIRMRYGISEATGCDGNLVVGNRISAAETAGASLLGTATSANAAHNYIDPMSAPPSSGGSAAGGGAIGLTVLSTLAVGVAARKFAEVMSEVDPR